MSADDLRAQVARIRPGDTVTVRITAIGGGHEATLAGAAWVDCGILYVGPVMIRNPSSGEPGTYIAAVLDHQPALPEEPPIWSVVETEQGILWSRNPDGSWGGGFTWEQLNRNFGPLTVRAIGVDQ